MNMRLLPAAICAGLGIALPSMAETDSEACIAAAKPVAEEAKAEAEAWNAVKAKADAQAAAIKARLGGLPDVAGPQGKTGPDPQLFLRMRRLSRVPSMFRWYMNPGV